MTTPPDRSHRRPGMGPAARRDLARFVVATSRELGKQPPARSLRIAQPDSAPADTTGPHPDLYSPHAQALFARLLLREYQRDRRPSPRWLVDLAHTVPDEPGPTSPGPARWWHRLTRRRHRPHY